MTTNPLWKQQMEETLPSEPGIKVNRDELLVLDWVICSASHLIPNVDLDYLVMNWHEFRLSIWAAIHRSIPPPAEEDFPLTDTDARVLMAVVPTTFRWGTGADCGYSLKMKLSEFLQGGVR